MGSRSLAVGATWRGLHRLSQRSGRAKRESQRLLVFQGMRALVRHGDRKSDIEKVSRNVAKTVKSITGEQLTQRLINQGIITTMGAEKTYGEKATWR
jgi:hypothetical protein